MRRERVEEAAVTEDVEKVKAEVDVVAVKTRIGNRSAYGET
jgi:hypothetical protein